MKKKKKHTPLQDSVRRCIGEISVTMFLQIQTDMYVCISPHLPRFQGRRWKSKLFRWESIDSERNKRTLRTQIMWDVENFKPGRNPVSYRKLRSASEEYDASEGKKIPVN